MAITQSEAKKRLSALSSQGGGIIYGAKKLEIDEQSNVLIIGLGGLGCRTVNEIAGLYKREFVDQGRLSVMAIDTDSRSFNTISSLNGGNIFSLRPEFRQSFDASANTLYTFFCQ